MLQQQLIKILIKYDGIIITNKTSFFNSPTPSNASYQKVKVK